MLDQPPPTRRAGDRDLWDPGAQPERTYQAWTRTALAFLACALLGTRLPPQAGPSALLVGIAGGVVAVALVRHQRRRLHSAVIGPSPGAVLTLTALTVALAFAALLIVTWPGR